MQASQHFLPPEIEAAVVKQHGGPISVPGEHGSHVVMSEAIFRDMMGVGDDDDFEKSVADLNESLAQAANGQLLSLEEVARRLAEKYGA